MEGKEEEGRRPGKARRSEGGRGGARRGGRREDGRGEPRPKDGRNGGRRGSERRRNGAGERARESPRPTILGSLFDRSKIPGDAADVIEDFGALVAEARGMNSRQRERLPSDIRRLCHELTDDRPSRRLGYMNDASELSAYASYYLWWNLERLVRLFSNLPASALDVPDLSAAVDVGSGPLTVPIALWLARPDLRARRLTWYCIDLSQNALSLGEELFLKAAARTIGAGSGEPWRIVRVRGELGEEIREKAALVTCANVFNEILQTNTLPTDYLAKQCAAKLDGYLTDSARVLLVEPGEPRSARFVSLMRAALMRRGFAPCAPCPHAGDCPMEGRTRGRTTTKDGRNAKWCNFAFGTEGAPQGLLRLSDAAGLSKDRATLSFLLASRGFGEEADSADGGRMRLRIASEPIRLGERGIGRYSCSRLGLTLALTPPRLRVRNGDLAEIPAPAQKPETDEKSGAAIVRL